MAVTLLSCECVEGLIPFNKLTQIYAAAYVLAEEDASLPTVECVAAMPPLDRLNAIYLALFFLADDDTLTLPWCVAAMPPFDRLTEIYAAAYVLADDGSLMSPDCVAGLPPFDRLTQIYAALYLLVPAEYDPDAEAFFARSGIVNEVQKHAVNDLVVALKAQSLWEKMTAIYPFVGGTAESHSKNLKADQYNITWNGVVTHDANGVTANGTTGYGDTNMSRTVIPLVSMHLAGYINTLVETGFHSLIGVDNFGAGGTQFTDLFHSGGISSFRNNATGGKADTLVEAKMLIGCRSATQDEILRSGSIAFDVAATAAAGANIAETFFVCALNRDGSATSFNADTLSLISVGNEFSLAESIVYRSAVDAFQTSLGRNV